MIITSIGSSQEGHIGGGAINPVARQPNTRMIVDMPSTSTMGRVMPLITVAEEIIQISAAISIRTTALPLSLRRSGTVVE
jgi:F0F1-type ATP synthase membrane subunit c/vacuolar-type H+-ATPase subunit K